MGRGRKVLTTLIEPEWERQPNETNSAFGLFLIYRGMGYDRSIRKVAAELPGPSSLPLRMSKVQNVSTRHLWTERIRKYEEFLSKTEIEDDIQARRDMIKRLREHASSAEKALMSMIDKFTEQFNIKELELNDLPLIKLFEMATKAVEKFSPVVETLRKLHGDTDIIQNQNTTLNLNTNIDSLTDDEVLQKIKELGFERKSDI